MGQNGGAFEMSGVDSTGARLRALVSYLRDQPDVVLVYLFGSHARHRARPHSDLDIALLLDEQGRTSFELLERRLDLATSAAEIVGGLVDVVLLNRAPLLLQGQVLGEGRLLYATDKVAQVEYEAHARALYFDFQPRLRQHRDALIGAAKEGTLG
jgi:hypothetical protein